MGKKKDKAKGPTPEKTKAPVIDWRQKLDKLNINTVYENRTCDVFLFVESNEVFYEVVAKFSAGSKIKPEVPYKIITNMDILNDIRYYDSTELSDELSLVYKLAREEAEPYSYGHIPLELLSKLIKLKIIEILTADINLMDPPIVPKKTESQMNKNRKSSILKPGNRKLSSKLSLPTEECVINKRHLYILLAGFYECDLFQYLFTIDVKFTAVLEIIGTDDDYTSEEEFRIPERASVTEDTFIKRSQAGQRKKRSTVDQGCQVPFTFSSDTSDLVPLYIATHSEVEIQGLKPFWSELYGMLDGNVKSEWLVNTAHFQIPRVFQINLEEFDDYEEQSIRTFEEIILEIQKIDILRKEYEKYINSLKIDNLDYKPKIKFIEKFKTYKLLADAIPPECFTIEVILNCVIEQVCSHLLTRRKRSQLLTRRKKKSVCIATINTPISQIINHYLNRKSTIISNTEMTELPVEVPRRRLKKKRAKTKSLMELNEWLKKCVHMISPHHVPVIASYEYPKLLPKTRLKIRERSFEIHSNNKIHHKAYCYPQISNKLINIQLDMLTNSYPVILLRSCEQLSFENNLIIKHLIQTWAKSVCKTEDEMRYIITTIAFENLSCQTQKLTLMENKSSLQLCLPERSYAKEKNTVLTQIKYINAPAKTPLIESTPPFMLLPILRHSINANVYESRNIRGYEWFEQLDKADLLQSLSKARKNYLCLDHRYCPFNDSILFRFHNRTDLFGINSKIWKKFIYSPVGFKDFCKYVYHQKDYDTCFGSTAYNFSNDRIQLHGTTTVFHSIDGCKVVAEQTNFIGRPTMLTVSVCVDSNYLVLECRETSRKQPFHFHFRLEDGTMIVLKKVSRHCKIGLKVAECLNKKPESPRMKPFRYNITEYTQKKHVRKTQDPIVVSKPRALTSAELQKFTTKCTCWFDDPIHCSVCKELFATSDRMEGKINRQEKKKVLPKKFAEEFNHIEQCRLKRKSLRKRSYTRITNLPDNIESDEDEYCRKCIRKPKPRTYRNVFFKFKHTKLSLQEILEKIDLARKTQIPLFKVCSSRLRKFSYMVPCKSTITIKIENEDHTILCSHPKYKIKREMRIIKIEPCRLPHYSLDFSHWYDMVLSLPTGLVLHTTPSQDEGPFNIKQEYIDKGPNCRSILEERSRTFMRDGRIVIKRIDGTINIIGNGGINMYCDLPYHATSFRAKNKIKKTLRQCTLDVNQHRSTQRQRLINYIVRTRARHVIGSHANRRFNKSRFETHLNRVQKYLCYHTKHSKRSKYIYYVQENKKQFTYTSHEGIKITVTDKTYENIITYHNDENNQEIFYEKPDGVKCILNTAGKLITEFPNGTRITTTFDTMRITEFDDCCIDDIPIRNVWIFIQMTYKFEHPNYITIYYDNIDFHSDIILQNNVNISITERGEYTVNVKKDYMQVNINRESIKYYSRNCFKCKQNFNALINISPLFHEHNFNTKEYEILRAYDTYDKMFSVFADGVCFKNSNFRKTRGNKFRCLRHDQLEHQKLFVLHRNLSGYKLWDAKGLRVLLRDTRNNPAVKVTGKEIMPSYKRFGYKFLKIETQIDAANYRLYNAALENPDFLLKIHQKKKFQLKNYLAVTNIHFINKPLGVYNFENSIHDAYELEDNWPFKENPPMKFLNNLLIETAKARHEPIKHHIIPEEILKTYLEKALSLCHRWYAWHKYFDTNTCVCRIHDDNTFPPLEDLYSDFTISSREGFDGIGANKSSLTPSGFESRAKRYSEVENLLDIMKNLSDCEVAREKWNLLENLSDTSRFSEEELLQFIHESFVLNKSISKVHGSSHAHKPDRVSRHHRKSQDFPSPGNSFLIATVDLECNNSDSDILSTEMIIQPPTREVFASNVEKYLQEVAKDKEIIREQLVELTKNNKPCDIDVIIDDPKEIETLYRRSSYNTSTHSYFGMNAITSSYIIKPPPSKKRSHKRRDSISQVVSNEMFTCSPSMRGFSQLSCLSDNEYVNECVGCSSRSTQNSPKCFETCEFVKNLYDFVNEGKEIKTLYKSSRSTCKSSKLGGKITSTKSLPNRQKKCAMSSKNTSVTQTKVRKTTPKKSYYNYSKETSTATSGRSSLKAPRPSRNKSRSDDE